jgi:hypothetical protein
MRYRALSRDGRCGGAGSFRRKLIEKLAAAGAVEPLARGRGSRRRSPCRRRDPRAFAATHDCRRVAAGGRRDPRSAIGAMTALYRRFRALNRRARRTIIMSDNVGLSDILATAWKSGNVCRSRSLSGQPRKIQSRRRIFAFQRRTGFALHWRTATAEPMKSTRPTGRDAATSARSWSAL